MDDTQRHHTGDRTRREVLGDAHVDRAGDEATSLTADFQDFITRYAWGEVWNRPGLDRRSRSLVTLGVLITLRAEKEIAVHIRGALRNGLTPDEIKEVIQQAAIYAGVPAAMDAFRVAEAVIEQR
jgi:4-carboxymuconolactone decarboxylase